MIVNARIPNSGKETQSTRNSLFGNTLQWKEYNPECNLVMKPDIRSKLCQAEKPCFKRDHDDVPQLDQGTQENSLAY